MMTSASRDVSQRDLDLLGRRDFVRGALAVGAGLAATGGPLPALLAADKPAKADIRLGMVTYQWANDWDLPTLLKNFAAAKLAGVELRTSHKHGVEPSLSAEQRREVKKQFADSPVTLVGIGSAEDFHNPDPQRLEKSIEATKAFIKLSHDVGGSGVKVRPNDLPKGVPQEKTIEQIGKSLNIVGAFGADYGQQIRLEIHGGCARLPIIKQIMDVATNPNVGVCWNCNNQDLEPPGLEHNFDLVKDRLGATFHVKGLETKGYPFKELMDLCVKVHYRGWWLLEIGGKPPADRVPALAEIKARFDAMLAKALA